MNKINKSSIVPASLSRGVSLVINLENEVKVGKKDLTFDRSVYAASDVKEQLKKVIEFHKHIVVAKDDNLKGKNTIALLKLNDRKDLKERRERRWEDYEELVLMKEIARKLEHGELLSHVQSQMLKFTSESSEFTEMFKYQK